MNPPGLGQNTEGKSPPVIRRGEQFQKRLRAAIIGGGKACDDLLVLLTEYNLNRLNMEILGVADPRPDAPGITRARSMGVFTTEDFNDLYTLPGLNLLIELTGSMEVREQMIRTKPLEISSIDHRGARLLWDLIQLEADNRMIQEESEKRLRLFLESAHDIICIKDPDGRYLYINQAATASMGKPQSEVLGKTDFELFPKSIARAMWERDQEMLRENRTVSSKETMTVEGQSRHFNTVRFPIFNEQGELDSYAIISRDMTEEMNLQEAVRQNKEYLENILNNSSDMIITTDLEGRIVTFNPGGTRMLGYTSQEVLGRNIETLWKDPEQRREIMARVEEHGAVNNAPGVLVSKDGESVEISLSLSQLRDNHGRILGTVGISKDVTEENRLRKQLIEQERLAAVGQTVAGITHCMKNVLNGLKGGAYILNVGLKRNEWSMVEEGWENVQSGIDRISKLSLDMLNYCRDRKPNPVPVDPVGLARETVDMVSKAASQDGIDVKVEGQEGSQVPLDKDFVGRALLNLVTNAVDACREKTYGAGDTPRVVVRVDQEPGVTRFRVTDNGAGMTEEVKRHLFERFYSTKEAEGTGLGLCVTHKIVTEHGGRLHVDSEPGKGSTFSMEIPTPQKGEHFGDTA